MKKFTCVGLSMVLALGLLAGCGGNSSSGSTTSGSNTSASQSGEDASTGTQLSGTVSTDGSTSMESVIGVLGEQFKADTGVSVSYNPTGSGAGIEAVSNGSCDIGLASRALTDEEIAGGLTETVVALDGIAIIVNAENSVTDLTLEQIAQIYTGEVTDWSEFGSDVGAIANIGRESGSGTRDGFEEVVDAADACVYNQELTSTGAVIAAVASNPNAIGYASLSAVDDTVKTLTVGGVECSEETIQSGDYAVQRNFVMVTNDNEELSAEAEAFLNWALSEDADEYVREAGCVPIQH